MSHFFRFRISSAIDELFKQFISQSHEGKLANKDSPIFSGSDLIRNGVYHFINSENGQEYLKKRCVKQHQVTKLIELIQEELKDKRKKEREI